MKEESKNTTPATSTPADTKKKKGKKADKPTESIAKVENGKIIVNIVKQTVNTSGVLTELKPKEIPVPANAKVEQLSNLASLIQIKVLVQLKEKFASEYARIKPAKGQKLTDEQKDKQKLIKAKIKLVDIQLEKYGYNAEKIALLINEPMAEILACWVTGEKIGLELGHLKTCLRANYQTISSLLDRLLKGESVKASTEDTEVFTVLRKALKADMDKYTAETFYFNQFKLSISLTDIRKWYEISRLDIAEDTFIFDDKKDSTLSKTIVKWFLTKLKVEPKADQPAPADKPAEKKASK